MKMQKVFFSYSRADGSEFALRLAVDLKTNGFDVWIDQEDIRAGLNWDAEIEKALENCDCLLYLETEKSVVSTHVLDEVYYAMEQHKKVIPLIFVDSRTPFRLKRLQHIDFTQDYNKALALLLNELEGLAPAVGYQQPENRPPVANAKPFYAKYARLLFFIACGAIVTTVIALLITKNNSESPQQSKATNSLQDTVTNNDSGKSIELPPAAPPNLVSTEKVKPASSAEENKKTSQVKTTAPGRSNLPRNTSVSIVPTTENNTNNLNEMVAGDWRLVSVEPTASSQRGYLQIEALSDNKANIKSSIQFYYPQSKAASNLTVFNAFAGCSSCKVSNQMKLKVEDIAVGSRTIKTLQQDEGETGKAGDVILDASSNKSIAGSVTLHFTNNTNAVITIKQPLTIALAHELMLQPFVYTFRFKKDE